MHHFIANAWDEAGVLRVARDAVVAAVEGHGPVAAWVVGSGIAKSGRHSVGVVRRYRGVLAKQDNCQGTGNVKDRPPGIWYSFNCVDRHFWKAGRCDHSVVTRTPGYQ